MTDERFAATIAALLRTSRLRVTTETALQESIRDVFAAAKIDAKREQALSKRDRPDFLLADGRVVVEAKTRYNRKAIYRQIERYAEHEAVTVIILVTGTALGMPSHINGKPIFVVSAGMGTLGC